jgi:hypothetical protein
MFPLPKLFQVTKGSLFDYRWQYVYGDPASNAPVDLTPYTATWVIASADGATIYETYTSGGTPGTSGVFFGGDTDDPHTGIIDLVITASDTRAISWTTARHYFTLTGSGSTYFSPGNYGPLLVMQGGIGIIGTLPSA